MTDNMAEIKSRITNIDITDENLTGRAGLTFISRYLRATKILRILHYTSGFTATKILGMLFIWQLKKQKHPMRILMSTKLENDYGIFFGFS